MARCRAQVAVAIAACLAGLVPHAVVSKGMVKSSADGVGPECAPVHTTQLIYNRIGKAGSSTMKHYFKSRSRKSRGFVVNDVVSDNFEFVSAQGEMEIVQKLLGTHKWFRNSGQPTVHVAHMHHIDWGKYRVPGVEPTYINLMREPAKRWLSQFNFWRSLDDIGPTVRELGTDSPAGCFLGEAPVVGCPPVNYMTLCVCVAHPTHPPPRPYTSLTPSTQVPVRLRAALP